MSPEEPAANDETHEELHFDTPIAEHDDAQLGDHDTVTEQSIFDAPEETHHEAAEVEHALDLDADPMSEPPAFAPVTAVPAAAPRGADPL